ncbi:DUF4087 domain-containing protein [Roseomonas rosulenta]|uniref:DUF4087 domain-containing protein n=1 Tax=Roseomonas rosulenta TaxID=2748667 RepID=UPI0018DFF917
MILAILAATGGPALAQERRCGWLDNPGPGNWSLTDRDGRWVLWTQGRAMPPGMREVTGMTAQDWVRPVGNYGYGCACLTVVADPATRVVNRVTQARQLPVSRCAADPALPPRG